MQALVVFFLDFNVKLTVFIREIKKQKLYSTLAFNSFLLHLSATSELHVVWQNFSFLKPLVRLLLASRKKNVTQMNTIHKAAAT